QPIGVDDVATRLAELATGTPAGRVADIGGPEILETRDILSRLQAAGRAKKRVLSISLPGTTYAAFKVGHHLAGLPGYGTQTFDEWLASGAVK
ncbi:MAG TPA: NAD-dependent epimerase/dehydratase family protein, partial [Pseudolysinimonas sp.]|nr:NAD-dependent epimerase/dehydratase family protein [Pseudolysinimonas sp.]